MVYITYIIYDIYVYICMYMYIYVYIYIYMGERRRERDLILLEKGFLVTSFYWNY